MPRPSAALLVLTLAAPPAGAQGDRPFDAETARLLPPGRVEVDLGAKLAADSHRPLFPSETGTRIVLPELGLRFGLGPWGELRLLGEGLVGFDPAGGEAVRGPGDWWAWTKVRLGPADRRVAWAARLGVKIPVASDAEGMGTDLADVELLAIATVRAGRGRLDLNAGLDLLGAPFRERSQQDLLRGAAALWWPAGGRVRIGGEIAGRQGGDFFPAQAVVRVGARIEHGAWRFDGAVAAGLAEGSPSWEVRAGVTARLDRRRPEPP
jgi:hypothetical protein